jgi:hypothetical protein
MSQPPPAPAPPTAPPAPVAPPAASAQPSPAAANSSPAAAAPTASAAQPGPLAMAPMKVITASSDPPRTAVLLVDNRARAPKPPPARTPKK